LDGSFATVAQIAPHFVVPPPQVKEQVPLLQTSPGAQACPHMPQLSMLLETSTQTVPHCCVPVPQSGGPPSFIEP
jgi:hypothetical protein